MDNQQPGSVYPSHERDETWPMELRAEINYDDFLESSDQQSWWHHQNAQETHCGDMLNEIPCLDDIILVEKGQSSGSKGSHDSGFLEMQTKGGGELQENGVKGDSDTTGQSKQQKRIRCPEVHNHNERIRRQKLKEKMKALQEIIPNCNGRDKLSTLDDAIKHIKTLQYQVQMMSTGGGSGCSAFPSPSVMMQQQQGVRIPYNTLPTFPQTGRPQGANFGGTEYQRGLRMGMEMAGMFQPNPYLVPPPDSGGTHLFGQPNSSSFSSMDPAPLILPPAQGAVDPSSQDPNNDSQFPASGADHLHWSEP